MKRHALAAAAAILLLCVIYPIAAFAQAVATTVDAGSLFGTWKPYLVEILGILAAAIVALLAELARRFLGLVIEKQYRDALQTALTNAAGLLLNKLGNRLDGKTIDVKHAAVAQAINYVNAAAPAALAKFGITPEQLGEKILAKLPQVANTTTPAV